MKRVGFYNGAMDELEKVQCPITDRAYYFGDGCYDATFVRNRVIFSLDEHLDRFYNGCRLLRIDFPYTKKELSETLYQIVDALDGSEGMLYWQASRGSAQREHSFPENGQVLPNLMAYIIPTKIADREKTFRCITVEDTRHQHCNIKTLNLLPNVLAAQKAKEAGCEEAIFHRGDRVTEMAHSNISFLIDDMLIYHPFDEFILPGISIKHLIKAAKALGIPTQAREITLTEAMNAQELINTSSGTICNRIVMVDSIPVGGRNPVLFKKLQEWVYSEFQYMTEKRGNL